MTKEKVRMAHARWRAANPEKMRASRAKWLAANPEKQRIAAKRWRAENPEKARAVEARWRASNPEKYRAIGAKWDAANAHKTAAKQAVRRARKKAASTALTNEERATISEIYRQCKLMTQLTGQQYHVDHKIALSRGGKHHPDNLQLLTATENIKKGTKPYEQFVEERNQEGPK